MPKNVMFVKDAVKTQIVDYVSNVWKFLLWPMFAERVEG